MTYTRIRRANIQGKSPGASHAFTVSGRHPKSTSTHSIDCETQDAANFKAALFRTFGFEGVTVQNERKTLQEAPTSSDGAENAEIDAPGASLSPQQEMTFRRIANAGAPPSVLRPKDVEHLVALRLVKKGPRRVTLTDVGKARIMNTARNEECAKALAPSGSEVTRMPKEMPKKPKVALSHEDEQLPPERAADLAKREAELRRLFTTPLVDESTKKKSKG